jgi:thiol-disulfide isomerase/thioredoxin
MVNVKKIGGEGAQNFIKNFKPNCLIVVTHPGCGHCRMLKPTLDKVYTDMKKMYTGDAEIFDLHGDAAQIAKSSIPVLEAVDGYPTLLISRENMRNPIVYSGDRTKEDIIKFMTDNLNIKKSNRTNKTKKSKKSKKNKKPLKKSRKRN